MKDLQIEMRQQMEKASKDKEWAKKVRNAGSWDTYSKLLKEKGIDVPVEVKKAFDANHAGKTGVLEDNDLEKVTGGWTDIFNCPKTHNTVLCELTFCPHIQDRDNTPDENHYDLFCDQGYWTENRSYQQKY